MLLLAQQRHHFNDVVPDTSAPAEILKLINRCFARLRLASHLRCLLLLPVLPNFQCPSAVCFSSSCFACSYCILFLRQTFCALYWLSPRILACSYLRHCLHHQTVHVAEIVYEICISNVHFASLTKTSCPWEREGGRERERWADAPTFSLTLSHGFSGAVVQGPPNSGTFCCTAGSPVPQCR